MARAFNQDTIAIGTQSRSYSDGGVAIGTNSTSKDIAGVALGYNSESRSQYGVSVGGFNTLGEKTYAGVVIVAGAYVGDMTEERAKMEKSKEHSTEVANGSETVIGEIKKSEEVTNNAVGMETPDRHNASIAIGQSSANYGFQSVAIGPASRSFAKNTVTLGTATRSYSDGGVAIGEQAIS